MHCDCPFRLMDSHPKIATADFQEAQSEVVTLQECFKRRIMSRLRILVLGPDCNPEQVSMPFVTYSHAAALARLHDVTLAVRTRVADPVRRANGQFRAIEVIRQPRLDRSYDWSLRRIFRYNFNNQALTAFGYPFYLAFEWNAWRQLRHRIFAGEFDVVLRIYPMNVVDRKSVV